MQFDVSSKACHREVANFQTKGFPLNFESKKPVSLSIYLIDITALFFPLLCCRWYITMNTSAATFFSQINLCFIKNTNRSYLQPYYTWIL